MGLVEMSSFTKSASSTSISIPSGQVWELKDYRGFTVFKVDENGDFYHKGMQVKL